MFLYKSIGLAAALLVSSPFTSATSIAEFAKRASGSSSGSIPPNFSPSATTQLNVAFQGQEVTPGEHLSMSTVKNQPQIGLQSLPASASSSSLFTVIMIDPDAPTPQQPTEAQILHWLQPSVRVSTNSSSTSSASALSPITLAASAPPQATYLQPSPPPGSAAHRYIQYLFVQPKDFQIPAAFADFGKGSNRSSFDVASFVQASGLQGPVAANYILVARGGNSSTGTGGNSTGKPQPFKGEGAGMMGASRWGWIALLGGLFVAYAF
ncbi:MAG: hypothetical protein M1821_008087 [Bathelium mastoideum]|nr:MAG: hypothetical protein M1821_008087 [Bathelium mastoideum]